MAGTRSSKRDGCTSRWGGHLWYRHSSYRAASGEERQVQRCEYCGLTRLSPQTPGDGRVGPEPGVTSPVPSAYATFWETVVQRYPAVGLPRAAEEAQTSAGITPSTRSRWLRHPRGDYMPSFNSIPASQLRLLEAALHVWRGCVPRPRVAGLQEWRRLRRHLHYQVDEPPLPANRHFEDPNHAAAIWQLVVRSACVAAVVRGEGIRPEVRDLVPGLSDAWLDVLLDGGLVGMQAHGSKRPVSFWIALAGAGVTAIAATRDRTVGVAGALGDDWRPMRFRLGLEGATYRSSGDLVLPVPAATEHFKNGHKTYDLVLRLGRKPRWRRDLDSDRSRGGDPIQRLF